MSKQGRDMNTNPPRVLFRQGDVLLERVSDSALPDGAVEVPKNKRGVVLAEGEVTGHAHRIPSRSASLYRTEQDAKFLRVMGPAPIKRSGEMAGASVTLEHEEHSTVSLPPGTYRVTIHAEYAPGELPRQVAD